MAVSALLLAVGHLLSTATFDLLAWTAISWLVVRVLRGGDQRLWLVIGLLAGVALLNKTLVLFLAAGLVIAVLSAGPRDILRSRWLWLGAAITVALWSPNLAWQASHGWPQLELSRAIAAGSSGTFSRPSGVRAVPAGVDQSAACTGVAGRPVAAAAGSSVAAALPLVPASLLYATPVVAVNYDAGETVGWPRFAAYVAAVYRGLPEDERARAVVLTRNYGEAGALDRYGPTLGLPPAYSGHNSYWSWGPPPDTGGPVIAMGLPEQRLQPFFGQVELASRIDNGLAVENEEQGAPIWICRRQLLPWAQIWPQLRRLA